MCGIYIIYNSYKFEFFFYSFNRKDVLIVFNIKIVPGGGYTGVLSSAFSKLVVMSLYPFPKNICASPYVIKFVHAKKVVYKFI